MIDVEVTTSHGGRGQEEDVQRKRRKKKNISGRNEKKITNEGVYCDYSRIEKKKSYSKLFSLFLSLFMFSLPP